MFDVFAKFATDEKKELEGAEVILDEGVSILVARAGNKNFLTMIQEEADEFAAKAAGLPKEEAERLDKEVLLKVLAKTVLLGWKGLSYKSKPIKYSVENAMILLGHTDFRKMVMGHAVKDEGYRAKLEEEDVKNS